MSSIFPQLTPTAISPLQSDGKHTPDTWDISAALYERNDWLHYCNSKLWASWCDGPDSEATTDAAFTADKDYDFGTFMLPPLGVDCRTLNVSLYISEYTTGNCSYYAQLVRPPMWVPGQGMSATETALAPRVLLGTPSATGWTTAITTIEVPTDAALGGAPGVVGLRITAETSAATNQRLGAVSVASRQSTTALIDGTVITSPWSVIADSAFSTPDRPDDAHTLRWLSRAQAYVAGLYWRPLAMHAFQDYKTYANVASTHVKREYHYRSFGSPDKEDVNVRIYCSGETTGDGAVTINVYADGSILPVETFTPAAINWYPVAPATLTILAAEVKANEAVDVYVETDADPGESGTATIKVYAICLEDAAHTGSDYVRTSGGRNDPIPTHWITPSSQHMRPGAPLVATHRLGGIADWGRWVDRYAQFHDAVWNAIYLEQTQVSDNPWRDDGAGAMDGLNATDNAFASADTLWLAKFTPRQDSKWVVIWARPYVVPEAGVYPRIAIYKDGSAATEGGQNLEITMISDGQRQLDWPMQPWRQIGFVSVTPGTLTELSLKAGFVNLAGVSTAPSTGWMALNGVYAVEVAEPFPATRYAYYDSGTISVAIPDNDANGATTTLAVAPTFTVSHVRVYVSTDHANKPDLTFKITAPGGAPVSFQAGTGTDAWYSDDLIGDTATTGGTALAGAAGGTSVGTWTLTVADTVATNTGNITRFELELW